MLSYIKFLKISLPLATGACAIVATTLLVASMYDKDKIKKKEDDEILKNLEKNPEEFKDEKITKPDENEKSDKELAEEQVKVTQDQKDKEGKKEEPDPETGKEVVKQLMEDASKIVIGDQTQRGRGGEEEIKLPPMEGGLSEESLEENGTPELGETKEAPPEGAGKPTDEIAKTREDGAETLETTDSAPEEREPTMDGPEGDTIQEEEAEVISPPPANGIENEEDNIEQDGDTIKGAPTEDEANLFENPEQKAVEDEPSRGKQSASEGDEDSNSGSAQSPLTEEQLKTFLSYQEATESTIASLGRLLFSR